MQVCVYHTKVITTGRYLLRRCTAQIEEGKDDLYALVGGSYKSVNTLSRVSRGVVQCGSSERSVLWSTDAAYERAVTLCNTNKQTLADCVWSYMQSADCSVGRLSRVVISHRLHATGYSVDGSVYWLPRVLTGQRCECLVGPDGSVDRIPRVLTSQHSHADVLSVGWLFSWLTIWGSYQKL